MKIFSSAAAISLLAITVLQAVGQNIVSTTAQNGLRSAAPAVPKLLPARDKEFYRLRPGDVIDIRFFFNPELNEQVQIRPDGRISLQLIGEVDMAESSIEDAAARIEQLAMKELKTPRISIQVKSYAEQKAYVTGEVYHPGLINLVGAVSVTTAISEAGGIKPTGSHKSVILIRKGDDGSPIKYKLDLEHDGKFTEQATALLKPFDVIMVPETKIQYVNRWVDQYIKQMNPVNLAFGFTYLRTLDGNHQSTLFPF
ncbi:MAG TPA: polysaccharide biosynthesis/export family protein [Terriglobia bacterium]|nr:polysaccharide biosynthesis/export family protein [Terriglobia bacterium]